MKSMQKKFRTKRFPVSTHLQSGQVAELMTLATALQSGFRTVLEELAAVHDFKAGPWLDDLERILVNDASNISGEGVPLDTEVRAIRGGRDHMSAMVTALRQQIASFEIDRMS